MATNDPRLRRLVDTARAGHSICDRELSHVLLRTATRAARRWRGPDVDHVRDDLIAAVTAELVVAWRRAVERPEPLDRADHYLDRAAQFAAQRAVAAVIAPAVTETEWHVRAAVRDVYDDAEVAGQPTPTRAAVAKVVGVRQETVRRCMVGPDVELGIDPAVDPEPVAERLDDDAAVAVAVDALRDGLDSSGIAVLAFQHGLGGRPSLPLATLGRALGLSREAVRLHGLRAEVALRKHAGRWEGQPDVLVAALDEVVDDRTVADGVARLRAAARTAAGAPRDLRDVLAAVHAARSGDLLHSDRDTVNAVVTGLSQRLRERVGRGFVVRHRGQLHGRKGPLPDLLAAAGMPVIDVPADLDPPGTSPHTIGWLFADQIDGITTGDLLAAVADGTRAHNRRWASATAPDHVTALRLAA